MAVLLQHCQQVAFESLAHNYCTAFGTIFASHSSRYLVEDYPRIKSFI